MMTSKRPLRINGPVAIMIVNTQAAVSRVRIIASRGSERGRNHRDRCGALAPSRLGIVILNMTAGKMNCTRGNAQALVALGG